MAESLFISLIHFLVFILSVYILFYLPGKILFSFELYGKLGKLEISGLGGSYGVEKLTYYRMLPEMGPPETQAWEFPMADDSWQAEFESFVQSIEANKQPAAGLPEAAAVLTVVETIYRKSGYDHC